MRPTPTIEIAGVGLSPEEGRCRVYWMRSRFAPCSFLITQPVAEALELDATREEVLAELGKPKSIAQRGG